jgi:hypothetical protein
MIPTRRKTREEIHASAQAILARCAQAVPVDMRLPLSTPVDRRLLKSQSGKTNPNPTATQITALSPRQLAAARMLARGAKPVHVAANLDITRQGLWKWRRLPQFVAEIHRLHELMIRG